MSERKRGYSTNDFEALIERRNLAPYPCWKKWRGSLYNRLKEKGLSICDGDDNIDPAIDKILHRFYVLRRRIQLGEEKIDSIGDFNRVLESTNPEIFENKAVIEAFRYISEKTRTENSKKP